MSDPRQPGYRPMATTPIAIVVAIAVVVALVALWGFSRGGGGSAPEPGPSPTVSPTVAPSPSPSPEPTPVPQMPDTLLWQVRDDALVAVDDLLIGSKTSIGPTALLYLPGGLLVDAGPAGETTLGRTALLSDTLASQRALSGLLGVRVTGTFVLDRLAFSGLVDAVNGVWIWTSHGRTHLNGPAAADYVINRAPGESEAEGIEKFSAVMHSILDRLPDDISEMRQLVTSLGSMARTTIPTEDIVAMLMGTHQAVVENAYVEDVLPTSVLRPGVQPIDVARQPAALQMLLAMFPMSVLQPGEAEPPRVLLRLGMGSAVTALDARDALVAAGFMCVNGGRISDQVFSRVRVPDDSEASRAVGARVAAAMGLAAVQIEVGGMSNPTVDAEVLLGSDWKPLP